MDGSLEEDREEWVDSDAQREQARLRYKSDKEKSRKGSNGLVWGEGK